MMREGILALILRVKPRIIIVHGARSPMIFDGVASPELFRFYTPEVTRSHPRPPVDRAQYSLPFLTP